MQVDLHLYLKCHSSTGVFQHFGSKNRLPGFYIRRTLVENGLAKHSSAHRFLKAHQRTTLSIRSETFRKSTNAKYKFFFTKYFSCNCLQIKMALVVPHFGMKPNCITSMSICCLINFSITLSTIFRVLSVNFSPLYFPHSRESPFPLRQCTIVLRSHSAAITPSTLI